MAVLWVIFILTSSGLHFVQGLPINPSSRIYPQEASGTSVLERWTAEGGLYAALPALALIFAAFGLLFGCTWCYRHKDCKPNEGADNQIFTASVTHLHEARRSQPPDSGFSEPANNNISEDNNNGPISLREMQNIANNNAGAYIVSENEERNRAGRESVVEFEPLPAGLGVLDPLERCADWFAGEDLPRDRLQYLREIGRGWFGRVVKGEIEDEGGTRTVAVKILNQNASLEDKARFLDEARLYRDLSHGNVLPFVAKCLQEDPWLLMFELCPMDLQQYIAANRPRMEALSGRGVPLQLMCDVTAALAHVHAHGYLYRNLWSGNILVRGEDNPRAVLGQYAPRAPPHDLRAPDDDAHPHRYTTHSDVWALGHVVWELCAWAPPPAHRPPPPPAHTLYGDHLYQVMQLCWNTNPEARPTAAQVHALVNHLHTAHARASDANDDGYGSSDFEERWQRLKPNTIPKIDEHVAIVHAPSTSMASHFTGSDQEFDNAPTIQDSLSVEMDTAVSRSSSIMSDKDPLSVQAKSDSLTNLHGSLEDVRNIYLTHNETATLECHQGNIGLEESKEREQDHSDSSVDPWLKDIITDSQDDVSYYKDVSDVIKNLDNILNSEKTSSSESSHQASPSRDNLSLECKKESPMQTSMVKSPGISNFKNILEMGFDSKSEPKDCDDDEGDADTIGTLSHSFERHSDTTSQQTLENITPETPIKDLDPLNRLSETKSISEIEQNFNIDSETKLKSFKECTDANTDVSDHSNNGVPLLKDLCVVSMPSISKTIEEVVKREDCQKPYANDIVSNDSSPTKSIGNKIDLRNGVDHKTIDSHKETDQNKITSNGEEIKTTVNNEDTPKNIKNAVDDICCSKDFFTEQTNATLCMPEKDTNEKVLDEVKQENINFCSEAVTDTIILENIQNDLLPNPTAKDEISLSTPKSSEINLISDLTNTAPTALVSSSLEKSNIMDSNIQNTLNSETFIVNTTAADQNIDDEFKNMYPSKSPVLDLNETPQDNVVNILPYSNLNTEVTTAATFEIDQKNSLEPLTDNSQKKISNSHLSSVANLSQSEAEKICCPNINEDVKGTGVDVATDENILQEIPSIISNNIIVNETFDVDENKTSTLNQCSLKQISTELPETVQISPNSPLQVNRLDNNEKEMEKSQMSKPEEQVQSIYQDINASHTQEERDFGTDRISDERTPGRVDAGAAPAERSCDSTIYMDLSDSKYNEKQKDKCTDNVNLYKGSEAPASAIDLNSSSLNESTVYLDLPNVIKETNTFLHSEKLVSSQSVDFKDNMKTSTPKGSENSTESTLEPVDEETTSLTKVPVEPVGDTFTKSKNASDILSPFESPTKSHHTDTYDENSSVVLGSLENCIFESLKSMKSELVDIPKEELLAFSSNFSEINLETPSPLRDGNFLNEVPDIISDEIQFDGIESISEAKVVEPVTTSESEEPSSTEKRVSPSTPPNSPGNFLATTPQMKYLVDIDINNTDAGVNAVEESVVHLNQIDLQMTTKLAMAENENNLNIEYSGPLVVEQQDSLIARDDVPECYLAGNAGSMEYQRDGLTIDEERMKELRNELELKLPLAQVSGIEPACVEWCPPPPPELVVAYGALSPIAEETRLQLTAYENDDHWNCSVRTESSESYPEPCNNSTDDVTDLPTGLQSGPNQSRDHSTYTLPSKENSMNHTYTVPKEVPSSSKEITMSADSLNASPFKRKEDAKSLIDDKTYTKADEEKDSNCERLSQISPFLLSPTTDTSAPDNSDLAAGMSTLSKITLPTDAKSSKPSETQCLSKATSIDSWCSNDTLYNVEENFDDLAMDPDILDFEPELEKDKSESEDTLTHNDDEKEHSHCSTYIVHDSKSEACDTFSPDSITANDNYTYTKAKTEVVATTPSLMTKSDLNDSNDTKNTQTKDLAYGTLMSGLPSYSNCTTELVSGMDDTWKLPQPELVRKSPMSSEINFTPPRKVEDKNISGTESPKFTAEPELKKMDSIDISCLKDSITETKFESPETLAEIIRSEINDSPNRHFRNMAHSVTSTPFLVTSPDDDYVEPVPMVLPQNISDDSSGIANNVPNFNVFFQSAEIRPQDITSNINEERASTEVLLEGDSNSKSRESNNDVSHKTTTYSDFEFSATSKPQDVNSKDKSSQSVASGVSSEEFRQFENSAANCPQDLSSLIDASSLLLKSERRCSELASSNLTNIDFDFTNPSDSRMINTESESLTFISPSYTNLFESQNSNRPMNVFITDIDMEDETEQPHSIIVTEVPIAATKLTSNRSFETHISENLKELNNTSDESKAHQSADSAWSNDSLKSGHLNEIKDSITDNIETETSKDLKLIDPSLEQSKDSSIDITNDSENRIETEITPEHKQETSKVTCNGTNEVYATINVINETFEELVESNVDDNDTATSDNRDDQTKSDKSVDIPVDGFESLNSFIEDTVNDTSHESQDKNTADVNGAHEDKVVSVTDDFLRNEKQFCQMDSFFPLLSDIRFTGPATEIMSTSFTQDSPTEPNSPECEQDGKPDPSTDILKEWDSDSDTHSTNSSSGEFIWKQRDSGSQPSRTEETAGGEPSSGSGDSGSGSEGDEVEFVPSSWDCRAAPSKSSLRSLEQPTLTQDTKKRVVFKRQKYHCVYEYPREAADADVDSPAYLPDFSTYSDWDATSAEEAEIGYGQLFGAPHLLDMFPLRAGIAFGSDYDEDFFISSSARPFESLGVMSTSSQFFPGMHMKAATLERDFPDDATPLPLVTPLPAPAAAPAPTTTPALLHTSTPSLDFTTPDSGVEDITPGSLADDDYKTKKLPEPEPCWRPADSASSSESASPGSPGEVLGGLRHTRDRLKLDLPPSPHLPSPKHNRVFSFVLDKPRRAEATPLVMTDDTPPARPALPLPAPADDPMPPPTFSTFGKPQPRPQDAERNIVLTDDRQVVEDKDEGSKRVEAVRGEGTVLDSGDEDSGIESSSKATLERNTPDVS